MTKLELLAPAANATSGKAAINYGADAVYIGASRFSARKAAGNNISEISGLIKYAHLYHAKVYAALNTLLKDQELDEAAQIIKELYEAGADAVIIQDMGLLEMDLPPVPLFASTQTNNRDWKKVQFLEKAGLQRVILARELSLEEIKVIRANTTVDLEFFVHGALCVSYSGQCYLSHAISGRSGNRGECAQPCRMLYSLVDRDNNPVITDRYLLSLKDLNLSSHLKNLVEAGISSFKIEGRLKDIQYVKNITAFYRKELDKIIDGSTYQKASSGHTDFQFQPDPERSFNRGFTTYNIKNIRDFIWSPETPKALGKKIGMVEQCGPDFITARLDETIANGDGICFYDQDHQLQGIRINKAEGNKLFPHQPIKILPGTVLYRNADIQFSRMLETDKSKRVIDIECILKETPNGIALSVKDEDQISTEESIDLVKAPAQKKEEAIKSIRESIAKTGQTIFEAKTVEVLFDQPLFIPNSIINGLRRGALEKLEAKRLSLYCINAAKIQPNDFPYPENELSYMGNIMNQKAETFYKKHGVTKMEAAFEKQLHYTGKTLMTTKHCLLLELGLCKKKTKEQKEPYFVIDKDHRYRLEFDCTLCVMKIML